MAMSDLLYSIFWPPTRLSLIHSTNLWLIIGKFGPALCKLACSFLCWRFHYRFDSESDFDNSGSICSSGISTPLSTHQIQAVSILHSRHVDSRSGCHFATFFHLPTRWILRGNEVRHEMEESIRRVLVHCRLPISRFYSVYIHPCDVAYHSLLHHPYQAQDTGTPKWTVREHTATEKQTKQKRASTIHCYCVSVCVMLVTLYY